MSRGAAQAQAPSAPVVSEREIQAGMVSYVAECIAAVGLAVLVFLTKAAA